MNSPLDEKTRTAISAVGFDITGLMVTPLHTHRFCIAPMMDWTDRHDRWFLRRITHHARLYTEMLTTGAVIHGDRARLLGFDATEHPVAIQLGGSDPDDLAKAARIAAAWGYDEVNLNCGCPSDRVQRGTFGACLMTTPDVVARCVEAMRRAVAVPVTVKCRIGVDDHDRYEDLLTFVDTVAAAGCDTFLVHARKAWLQGLSPRENREIPPLRPRDVHRLKHERPELAVVVNGGITDVDAALDHLDVVDGVMVGRAAYQNPWMLAEVDARVFGDDRPVPTRHEVVEMVADYAERHIATGGRLQDVARHVLGLFQGRPGARAWRRYIAENAPRPGATADVLREAAKHIAPDETGARAAA